MLLQILASSVVFFDLASTWLMHTNYFRIFPNATYWSERGCGAYLSPDKAINCTAACSVSGGCGQTIYANEMGS